LEEEKVVKEPSPGEKEAPTPEIYTTKEAAGPSAPIEPGGEGEGPPTPPPEPTEEGKK